jgi:hypothetical protein
VVLRLLVDRVGVDVDRLLAVLRLEGGVPLHIQLINRRFCIK